MTTRSAILSISLLSLVCCPLAPAQDTFRKYLAISDLESDSFFTLSQEARAQRIAEARRATADYLGARQQHAQDLSNKLKPAQDSGEPPRNAAREMEEAARVAMQQIEAQLNQVDDQMARLTAQEDKDPERKRLKIKAMQDIRENLNNLQAQAAESARRAKRMQEDAAAIETLRQQLLASDKTMREHLDKTERLAGEGAAVHTAYYDALEKIRLFSMPAKHRTTLLHPATKAKPEGRTFSWPGGGRFEGVFTYEADKKTKDALLGLSLSLSVSEDDRRSGVVRISFSDSSPIQIDLSDHLPDRAHEIETMRGVAGNRTFLIKLAAAPDKKDPANTVHFTIEEKTASPPGEPLSFNIPLRRTKR